MKQEKKAEMTGPRADLARAIGARDAVAESVEALRKTKTRLEDAIVSARIRIDDAKAATEADRESRILQLADGADLATLTRRDDGVADARARA